MALVKCPECGKDISDKAITCPHCGETLNSTNVNNKEEKKSGNNRLTLILAVVCVISLIGNFVQFTMKIPSEGNVNKTDEKNVVVDSNGSTEMNETSISIEQETTEEIKQAIPEGAVAYYYYMPDEYIDERFTKGMYKCGVDFEPGTYFLSGIEHHGQWKIYSDISEADETFYSFGILKGIEFSEGQYVELDSSMTYMIPESVIDIDNLNQYGIFKVGEDIPEGEYKVEILGREHDSKLGQIDGWWGAYEISEDLYSNTSLELERFNDSFRYIDLKEGQYIKMINVAIYALE